MTRVARNPGGEIDEWGRPRDRERVECRFDHAGPGAGAQNVALDWAAAWKWREPPGPEGRIPRAWPRTRN